MKLEQPNFDTTIQDVAPFTGAWIEIICPFESRITQAVAPFTGAWIEIYGGADLTLLAKRRSLYGGVD